MKFNNFFNFYPNKTKPFFRKLAMGFSLCYLLIFFKSECSNLQQSIYSKKLQCSWDSFWRKSQEREIELNNLPKRISALQYNANDPIEDRYSAVELKNFKGYFISVLDGHGGFQLSQYANERLFRYFDEIYKDLKLAGKITDEDELVKAAMYSSFDKVEKEFYNIAVDLYKNGEGKVATVGSCVLISIISPKKVYTAQLGDSKAKLFQKSEDGYKIVRITNTHNAEKKREQEILFKEFSDRDIVVCKRPNNTVCYVKGRLQPTRVY
jgi:pyruvate dehydrogenase phosphatase